MVEVRKLEKVAEKEVRNMAKYMLGLEGELDTLVEEILTPDKEGYAWTWAELNDYIVGEVVGEKDLGFYPLAESWDLLAVKGDKVLGIVSPEGAPYFSWERLIETLLNVEKEVRKLLKIKSREKERANYFKLVDGDGEYGIVKVALSKKEFKKLLDEYRESDPDYDNEGLIEFLKEKGIEAELINPEEVYF